MRKGYFRSLIFFPFVRTFVRSSRVLGKMVNGLRVGRRKTGQTSFHAVAFSKLCGRNGNNLQESKARSTLRDFYRASKYDP